MSETPYLSEINHYSRSQAVLCNDWGSIVIYWFCAAWASDGNEGLLGTGAEEEVPALGDESIFVVHVLWKYQECGT